MAAGRQTGKQTEKYIKTGARDSDITPTDRQTEKQTDRQ